VDFGATIYTAASLISLGMGLSLLVPGIILLALHEPLAVDVF
jgi:hypothetical protein